MTLLQPLLAALTAALLFSIGTDARAKGNAFYRHKHSLINRAASNRTADTADLKTWWHNEGVYNNKTAVGDQQVRQSHQYTVQVSLASTTDYYDSFIYETIPRSGKGKLCDPYDLVTICDEYDGVSIEDEIGVSMAWTQFLYNVDVKVRIARVDGAAITASDVSVRPTTLEFQPVQDGNGVVITVPHRTDVNGYRFSVEFANDLWEYQTYTDDATDTGGAEYVQDVEQSAADYVPETVDLPVVGREPTNALLIFASPFPPDDMVPVKSEKVYDVTPGYVSGLESIQNSILSFGPGVYHFTGKGHANLSSTVSWVYLAPGAYVKGALQWNNGAEPLKATGFGVLSGEQYVYQANPANGWKNTKSDDTSLKMFRGNNVSDDQTWTLHGLTMVAPPFNAMDFYSGWLQDIEKFSIDVADYKQLGGFYAQTDGLQMYPNSHVRDVFYHTGDDTLKLYYSNVKVENVIAWKTNNAPTIQIGWHPRNVTNVTVSHLDVIHQRYATNLAYAPRAIIGSSSSYTDLNATDTANITSRLSDFLIEYVRAEGISPALLGWNLLANIDNFVINEAWIEELAPSVTSLNTAIVRGFTDGSRGGVKVAMGDESTGNVGLLIEGYKVGDTNISIAAGNYGVGQAGGLDIDPSYAGRWDCIDSTSDGGDTGDDGETSGADIVERRCGANLPQVAGVVASLAGAYLAC